MSSVGFFFVYGDTVVEQRVIKYPNNRKPSTSAICSLILLQSKLQQFSSYVREYDITSTDIGNRGFNVYNVETQLNDGEDLLVNIQTMFRNVWVVESSQFLVCGKFG